jgi:hypothetical protein
LSCNSLCLASWASFEVNNKKLCFLALALLWLMRAGYGRTSESGSPGNYLFPNEYFRISSAAATAAVVLS